MGGKIKGSKSKLSQRAVGNGLKTPRIEPERRGDAWKKSIKNKPKVKMGNLAIQHVGVFCS